MNRFAHDNLDPSLTMQRRLLVMTRKVGPPKCERIRCTGRDEYAATRLERRRHAYDKTIASLPADKHVGYTRPGSTNHHKT